MESYLFVYGTLRSDCGSAHATLMSRLFRLGRATVQGRLYEIDGYPGLVAAADPHDRVHGEVYVLAAADVLERLDVYEGCSASCPLPHEYARQLACVTFDDGRALDAWVYFYRHPLTGRRQITSGDYARP